MESRAIADCFGRRFPYLRLSVTDVCNFRCSYCLPDGYRKTHGDSFLSVDEIRRLVTAFAQLGAWKVRLTGGEPTLRDDFCAIARNIADIPGIQRLALTTNGYRLVERAAHYRTAGLSAINISIDSLDPRRFQEITGHARLAEVSDGVQAALAAGFERVKINTVLLRGLNDEEIDRFLDFIADRPIALRFIELMQTGDNLDYFRQHHIPATIVKERLLQRGWRASPREEGSGPAVEYVHTGYRGRVGLIAPYAKDFCAQCNRLRVSARGQIQLCLFGADGHDLRPLLQSDAQIDVLKTTITGLLAFKASGHLLARGETGARQNLSTIGG